MTDYQAQAEALIKQSVADYRTGSINAANLAAQNATTSALLAISQQLDWLPPRMLGQVDPLPSSSTDNPDPVYLDEIIAERQRQIAQGYTTAHDDEHGWRHLVQQIGYRVQSRLWGALGDADAREELVIMAALAVAGIETIDRKSVTR